MTKIIQTQQIVTNLDDQEMLPIFHGKISYAVSARANKGMGMSDAWWQETFRLKRLGTLQSIYKTKTGSLRRKLWSPTDFETEE